MAMNPVVLIRQRAALTQKELACAAGTSQPTIAAYEAGRKRPTVHTLERLARASGAMIDVRVVRAMTTEERRSLLLHEAIAAQLLENPRAVLRLARRNLALMRREHPCAHGLLREWAVLLRRPLEALLPVLSDRSEWARELRHVTPFAGAVGS
ncbi:hypothetical protein BH11GEM1_BH11GEM1_02770 [soil metagenome]